MKRPVQIPSTVFALASVLVMIPSQSLAIGPAWAEIEVAAVTGSISDLGRIPFTLDLQPVVFSFDLEAAPELSAIGPADGPADGQGWWVRLGPTIELNLARADDLLRPRGDFGDWDSWARSGREADAAPFVARLTLRF